METFEGDPSFLSRHDAVLSRLEYWQDKDGDHHYYPKAEFERTLNSFSGNPIIYANRHPFRGLKGANLEEVLKEINGKIVGYGADPMINNMGSPKLVSTLNITDQETDTRIKNGEVSISLGFWHKSPKTGYLNNVVGDHILLYPSSLGIPQGDPASLIVNQDNSNSENKDKEALFFGYSAGEFGSGAKRMVDEKPDTSFLADMLKANQDTLLESKEAILKLNQELDTEKETVIKLNQAIGEKDKLLSEQAEQITTLSGQIQEIQVNQLKANQEAFWNSAAFTDGTREKFASRKGELDDLRTSLKLNTDMLAYELSLKKPDFKEAEGNQRIKENQDPEAAKPMAYDPYKGVMI